MEKEIREVRKRGEEMNEELVDFGFWKKRNIYGIFKIFRVIFEIFVMDSIEIWWFCLINIYIKLLN